MQVAGRLHSSSINTPYGPQGASRGVPASYFYLESGSSDGVDPLEASRHQFSLAHVEQPVELATRVLRTVEGCKPR